MRYSNNLFADVDIKRNKKFSDERGANTKIYEQGNEGFVPIEVLIIRSRSSVIRGLHYQKEKGQTKRITCISGKIYVTIADVSPKSENFGKWCSINLSDNGESLIIPGKYAVGTYAYEDSTFLCECAENPFVADLATGIRFDDETLDIEWPSKEYIVSERDKMLPSL